MLATGADVDLLHPDPAATGGEVVPPVEDDEPDEPLAPARGLALGMALGMVSIGIVALLGWWMF
jgi:hypothetical protein